MVVEEGVLREEPSEGGALEPAPPTPSSRTGVPEKQVGSGRVLGRPEAQGRGE